jgi:hypothetical protein
VRKHLQRPQRASPEKSKLLFGPSSLPTKEPLKFKTREELLDMISICETAAVNEIECSVLHVARVQFECFTAPGTKVSSKLSKDVERIFETIAAKTEAILSPRVPANYICSFHGRYFGSQCPQCGGCPVHGTQLVNGCPDCG